MICYKQYQLAAAQPPERPRPTRVDAKPSTTPAPKSFESIFRLWRALDRNLLMHVSLFALLLFVLWLNIDYRRQLDSLKLQFNAQNHSRNGMSTTNSERKPLSILTPPPGSMVLSNTFSIKGEAVNNQILTLSVDDAIKAVTLPQDGRFEFSGIRVDRDSKTFTIRAISESGVVSAIETVHFEFRKPTPNFLSKDVTRGDVTKRQVALTFDGGYLDNASGDILDVLKAQGVKSTMFLSGTFIRKFPDAVKRMVAEGHEIGNHSNHHPHLTDFTGKGTHVTRPEVTREFLHKELNEAAEAFNKVTGKAFAPLWRAPYGEHNLEIRQWAAELGYRHVGWTLGHDQEGNMDTMDWVADTTSPAYLTADEILGKVLNFGNGSDAGANGAIIIMHLGTQRLDDFPHQKLAEIIDGLRQRGYQLVRASEMID
ncbi:MAG TPA: polysaccharide deacetylase family protein [bacterium]